MEESANLSKIAYENILEMIVEGKIKLGSLVSQNAICRLLPMSRTPIREALFALESHGILEKKNTKYFVSYLSKEDIIGLYEVRKILEGNSARMCCININSQGRSKIKSLIRNMKVVSESEESDAEEVAKMNGKFHETIANLAGNVFLADFIKEILIKLKIVRISLLVSQDRREEEFKEHEEIANLILNKDPLGAQLAMERHEQAVLDFVEMTTFKKLFIE